jgi:hypothetical protein
MRQVGNAIQQYMSDYGDRFPAAFDWGAPPASPTDPQPLFKLIKGYAKTSVVDNGMTGSWVRRFKAAGIFACPSDIGLPPAFGEPPSTKLWWYTGCSFEFYANDQKDWEGQIGSAGAQIRWTGLAVKTNDATLPGGKTKYQGAPISSVRTPSRKAMVGDTWYWHSGDLTPSGARAWRNTLYCDGHTKRVKYLVHLRARIETLADGW